MSVKRYRALAFQRRLQLLLQSVLGVWKAVSSISELPAPFGSKKGVPPGPGPVGPTKQAPCLTQPRQMRRLKMMKYHFFRRLRPHSRASCCTCTKKKRARNAHHSPNRIRVHWSGEARARPRDANFLRGAGGSLAELFSVCVCLCNGARPKKSRILENRVFVSVIPTT